MEKDRSRELLEQVARRGGCGHGGKALREAGDEDVRRRAPHGQPSIVSALATAWSAEDEWSVGRNGGAPHFGDNNVFGGQLAGEAVRPLTSDAQEKQHKKSNNTKTRL